MIKRPCQHNPEPEKIQFSYNGCKFTLDMSAVEIVTVSQNEIGGCRVSLDMCRWGFASEPICDPNKDFAEDAEAMVDQSEVGFDDLSRSRYEIYRRMV